MEAKPGESGNPQVDASDLAAISEPVTPPDAPDTFTQHDRDLIEGTPTAKLDKERIRARKALERQVDDLRAERDSLRINANRYERLDDRRRGIWLSGGLGGLTGAGGALAAAFPNVDQVRVLGGTTAAIAAVVLILVSIHQGRKPP